MESEISVVQSLVVDDRKHSGADRESVDISVEAVKVEGILDPMAVGGSELLIAFQLGFLNNRCEKDKSGVCGFDCCRHLGLEHRHVHKRPRFVGGQSVGS